MSKRLFIIEIASKKNAPHYWGPTGHRLRGRYDSVNVQKFLLGDALRSLMEHVPRIPGIIVYLLGEFGTGEGSQVRAAKMGLLDPMREFESHHRVWEEVKKVTGRFRSELGQGKDSLELMRPVNIETREQNQVKNWLYWMARVVEAGSADDLAQDGGGEFREGIADRFDREYSLTKLIPSRSIESKMYGSRMKASPASTSLREEDRWTDPVEKSSPKTSAETN